MFDEGSPIFLLNEDIANQLGIQGRQSTLTLQWYWDNVGSQKSYKVNCVIEGLYENPLWILESLNCKEFEFAHTVFSEVRISVL